MATKTWARATTASANDYQRVPCIVSYTAGHASNWQEHEAAPEALVAYITNTGSATAYVSQGIPITDGAARGTNEGLPLAPGQTQRIDFGGLSGQRAQGDEAAKFYTVGVNLRIHFTLL